MPYPRQIALEVIKEVDRLRGEDFSLRQIAELIGVSHNTVWEAEKMNCHVAKMTTSQKQPTRINREPSRMTLEETLKHPHFASLAFSWLMGF